MVREAKSGLPSVNFKLYSRTRDITGFYRVESFPKLFEGLLSGKSQKAFEARSDTELIDDCMWLLEKFLAKKLPRPTSMKRTKWVSNRNFLGTYSFVSVEQERSKTSPRDLAASLKTSSGKPSVLFAGEATNEQFKSYTHGAIASGYRAATELIDFLKK